MSKPQVDKVAELLAAGWKVIPSDPLLPGAPVEIESPDGKRYIVDAAGNVTPKGA